MTNQYILPVAFRLNPIEPALLQWIVVGLLSVLFLSFRAETPWLNNDLQLFNAPVASGLNVSMQWFVDHFSWLFAAISWLLSWPMDALQSILQVLPWAVTLSLFALIGFVAGGWRLSAFTAVSLFYMVVTGYWQESMNTLALVGVAAPLAAALGFGLGILGYCSPVARRIIRPCLDLMQTVPTFAYLVPLLLLFGFGPVVGLIAGAIYACPPMVKNVMHGLSAVPSSLIESGIMSGTTRRQCFWWVKVPAALPQIMVGLNQTIMATLSMVIIAAIIGGYNDIGWEVLSTMRKAQFGQSLLSGLVIALIAMILDRISWGFTVQAHESHAAGTLSGSQTMWLAFALLLLVAIAAHFFTALDSWPDSWRLYPASQINEALGYVVTDYSWVFDGIKNGLNYYFLLPIKIGVPRLFAAMGMPFTPATEFAYWALFAGAITLAYRAWTWGTAVLLALVATVCFFGLTQIPWAVVFLVVGVVAWQAGGISIAAFALAGMSFILLTGLWEPAVLSLYLCGAAVAFSFVVGGILGVFAAKNDSISAVIRPVNDTLQTMPQFVYLIPIIFLFGTGDLPALVAIIAYSIVPMIRYTEHAIRSVSPGIVEAAAAMGCTERQKLFQVQLAIAWPSVMLGLNQTIMYALSMLVIAALVGTRDIGQEVYKALTKADTGVALTAGLSIAIIAMIADCIIHAWAETRRQQLGLPSADDLI